MLNPNNKPSPPQDNECCDNACNPCVWDNYYSKLQKWRIEQDRIRGQQQADEELLNKK